MAKGCGYGAVCGVLIGASGRCYALGLAKYGGRCRQHEQLGEGYRKPRQAPRCGYRLTYTSFPCSNPVFKPGNRCGRHHPDALALSARLRREELQERIARSVSQRDKVEQRLAVLRAELHALDDETGGPRVAEG